MHAPCTGRGVARAGESDGADCGGKQAREVYIRSSGIGKLLEYYRRYKYEDYLQVFTQRNCASATILRLFQR